MKLIKTLLPALALVLFLSSCTARLVDFTVISTKNCELGTNKLKSKRTEGKKTYFLGIGFNLKDAIDIALENAGSKYDLLIDGVVTYSNYPFVVIVKVKGKAVSTAEMTTMMGEEGFQEWCKTHNVLDPKTATAEDVEVIEETGK